MTVWTGSSYIWFDVEGGIVGKLQAYKYDFDDAFHITTHFLGREPLRIVQSRELFSLVRWVADMVGPMELPLTEFATFGQPSNPARVAKFSAPPALYRWRTALAASLENHDIPVSKDWPWDPHMTYAYGFDQKFTDSVEKQLLEQGAAIMLTALCAFDGRAKLTVPLGN